MRKTHSIFWMVSELEVCIYICIYIYIYTYKYAYIYKYTSIEAKYVCVHT